MDDDGDGGGGGGCVDDDDGGGDDDVDESRKQGLPCYNTQCIKFRGGPP